MDLEGTPGTPRDDESNRSAQPEVRIQPGMSGSPSTAFPDPQHTRTAEVIPIRVPDPAYFADDEPHIPIWMQRANLVMKFLICVWIGMILTVLPWISPWTENSLIVSLPHLRSVFMMDFVRGMVTGIGLLDIWIGIWEAVHYHDRHPAPRLPQA